MELAGRPITGAVAWPQDMAETLSVAEAKELIQLCRAGRLYEVEAWIRAGRSLDVPREVRTTPLRVALETGFHSLIERLLRHEASHQVKNDLLREALFMDPGERQGPTACEHRREHQQGARRDWGRPALRMIWMADEDR